MCSDELTETEARHSSPRHFAATCHAEEGYYQSPSSKDNRAFLYNDPARARPLRRILKRTDRSNYHLPTSAAAPTPLKSTTFRQTSCALKLTFTSANN